MDEQKSLLDSLSSSTDEAGLRETLKGQELATSELESSFVESKAHLDGAIEWALELKTAHLDAEAAYEALQAESRATQAVIQSKKSALKSDIAVHRAEIRRVDAESVRVDALLEAETCPSCEQSVPVEFLRGLLAEAASSKAAALSDIEELRLTLETHNESQVLAESEYKALERPVSTEYDAATSGERSLRVELRVLKSRIEHAREREVELSTQISKASGLKSDLRDKISETQTGLNRSILESEEAESRVAQLELCVEMFGNGGLKSFLIESAVPEINKSATTYVRRLCGEGATVQLRATTNLKGNAAVREKLSVIGYIPGCADTYEGASKGQKKRLDLALLLAYREIVANRSSRGIEQLFADELFDGLDRSGMDGVVELLRELAVTSPVIMVTHDDRLKSAGDHMILVRHAEGCARIVGSPKKKRLRRRVSI
jgi:hypothetical protein